VLFARLVDDLTLVGGANAMCFE